MLAWRYPDTPIEAGLEFLSNIREDEWNCSGKYDGWRAVIYTDDNHIPTVFSKMGKPLVETNADIPFTLLDKLMQVCKGIPPNSVLDAEFVGPRGGHDPRLFIFDLLAWNSLWLVNLGFKQRRDILLEIHGIGVPDHSDSQILHAETVESGFADYFQRLRKIWYDGNCSKLDLHEGIVLKRLSGKLTLSLNSSVKSQHMYKLKYRDVREQRY